jgi:hypothetical protein
VESLWLAMQQPAPPAGSAAAPARWLLGNVTLLSTETHVEIEKKPFTVYRLRVEPTLPRASSSQAAAPAAWVVSKRFSDFADLRSSLQAIDKRSKSVAATLPFPPKHYYGSMQDGVVERRYEVLGAWVEGITEAYRNAVPLLAFLEDDGFDNATQYLLAATSFLRANDGDAAATGGPSMALERPLTAWGERSAREKSCFLVSAAVGGGGSRRPEQQVLSLLTLSHPHPLPRPCPVALGSKSHAKHLRSFFAELEHPFILPVLSLGLIPGNEKALVFRPFCTLGSVRDLLHKAKTPVGRAAAKYAKGGCVGLNERQVALFGRQILQGLCYLQQLGLVRGCLCCVVARPSDWERLDWLPTCAAGSGHGSNEETAGAAAPPFMGGRNCR